MSKNNYSGTKCPCCQHTDFEVVGDRPKAAAHDMYYLRCCSCKTFLFGLPAFDINTQIIGMHNDIIKIKKKLGIW